MKFYQGIYSRNLTPIFLPRFIIAAKDEASVRKTIFFRARHVVTDIEKSKLSLLHLLHTFVSTLLKIVAGRGGPVSHVRTLQGKFIAKRLREIHAMQ